ncbi:MAG: protein kinase [Myxococcota bacterium]|nr:protein kinase [Myxococcota bacterium]
MFQPQLLGPYLLLERISIGGMAEVFKARHQNSLDPSGFVVVKRILPHLAEDERFITMFEDEAFFASALNHPTIPRCLDASHLDSDRFMVLEHVVGQDLVSIGQRLRKADESLSVSACVHICRQAALALDTAHKYRGPDGAPTPIVHRDISPENIMVAYTGSIHVIDFGIARIEGRRAETQVGSLKGKLGYMTPEQIDGATIDPRTDIFALGSVLHELLSGKPLFVGENDFMTVDNVRRMDIPAPSEFNPAVPAALDEICLTALRRAPESRFQTAAEFVTAIDTLGLISSEVEQTRQMSTTLGLLFADAIVDEEERNERFSRLEVLSDGDIVENARPAEDTTSMWEPEAAPGKEPPTSSMRAVQPQEVSLLGGRIDGTKPPAPLDELNHASANQHIAGEDSAPVSVAPSAQSVPSSPEEPKPVVNKPDLSSTADVRLEPPAISRPDTALIAPAQPEPTTKPKQAKRAQIQSNLERTREVSAPFPVETGSSYSAGLSSAVAPTPIHRLRNPVLIGLTIVLGLLCAQLIVKLISPTATGTLIVKVKPASPLKVRFDNEVVNVDTAPFVLRTIKVGRHELSIQAQGYQAVTKTVQLRDQDANTVFINLKPTNPVRQKAKIKLFTIPRDAQVRLSTSAATLRQNQFLEFDAQRPLEFVAELGGYETRRVTHLLRPDETRTVLIRLEPIEGSIMVDSQPPAEIFINGRRRGRSPTTLRHLDINQTWQVKLVAQGHPPVEKEVKFNGKRLIRIDENFETRRRRRP